MPDKEFIEISRMQLQRALALLNESAALISLEAYALRQITVFSPPLHKTERASVKGVRSGFQSYAITLIVPS